MKARKTLCKSLRLESTRAHLSNKNQKAATNRLGVLCQFPSALTTSTSNPTNNRTHISSSSANANANTNINNQVGSSDSLMATVKFEISNFIWNGREEDFEVSSNLLADFELSRLSDVEKVLIKKGEDQSKTASHVVKLLLKRRR